MSTSLFYAIFLTLVFFLLYQVLTRLGRNEKLPPGPKGLPLVGNMLELRGDAPIWHAFDRLKEQYGPIVYLNFGGQNVVLLNTKEVANELLDRRSYNYSDRSELIVSRHLGGQRVLPLMRYDKTWQTMRRASHSVLNIRMSANYHPAQTDEAVILAFDLLNKTTPQVLTYVQRTIASTVVSLVYGLPPLRSSDDPILKTLNSIAHRFAHAAYPGAFLVELLPFMDFLPPFLAKWKREAQADCQKFTALFKKYFNDASVNHGQKSSLSANLSKQTESGLTDLDNAWLAGTLYAAGFETTSSTLAWLLLALSMNPSVQRKAQEEIDRVVGHSRAPTFADMEHMPYVRALVKEILRWQPALPFGIPHVSLKDDWYKGYFIPKGTICLPTIWSMNRSTDVYGLDATEFRPDRFMNEDGTLRTDLDGDGHFTYGFGRRICVGRHVADNSLLIDIATILWALNIEPSPLNSSPKAKPSGSQKDILNPPPDLQCEFVARFPEVESILKHMRDDILQARLM
jgi:cytochrome P450